MVGYCRFCNLRLEGRGPLGVPLDQRNDVEFLALSAIALQHIQTTHAEQWPVLVKWIVQAQLVLAAYLLDPAAAPGDSVQLPLPLAVIRANQKDELRALFALDQPCEINQVAPPPPRPQVIV